MLKIKMKAFTNVYVSPSIPFSFSFLTKYNKNQYSGMRLTFIDTQGCRCLHSINNRLHHFLTPSDTWKVQHLQQINKMLQTM